MKKLTEADLIEGNTFECIETSYSMQFIKGNIYECEVGGEIMNSENVSKKIKSFPFLNTHFKLLPSQEESVKGEEINNTDSHFQVVALQQQLKEAKELLKKAEPLIEELKISSPLNRPICNSVVSSINQFLNSKP